MNDFELQSPIIGGDTANLFSQGQIKLAELSVYNWGSFHGLHTASIDPEGTLVTGDNGAGKSTFIDGLMALLLPAGKATFNVAAAQGDRSDRSLLSYMRGSFGSTHDGAATRIKSKREKGVMTGLRALYKSEDGSCITLAALFWTTGNTNALSDVKRLYLVAKRNLSLKELLQAFGEGDIRQLKQWLREDPDITDCDSHFADYQELYRKYLHMDNKNAPALLSRALGLKKIDDLTKLIRELVLEPSGVQEDAKRVVEAFTDLVAIHDQLEDAKAQFEQLQSLPEQAEIIRKAEQDLARLQLQKSALNAYFGEALARLWQEKLQALKASLETLKREIDSLEVAEKDAQKTAERLHEAYLNLGGDRIESLKRELYHAQERLKEVNLRASNYQADCQSLGLEDALEEVVFHANQRQVESQLANLESEKKQKQDAFGQVAGQLSEQQRLVKSLEAEIQEIEARPDSNIDLRYQQLRDEMLSDLTLSKEELIFIGEMLDVKETERAWQGAIERALGGLRTTLLVPQKHYSKVTHWLNSRHTGLHVRAQVVLESHEPASKFTEFQDNGYLRKLVWKEHPYRDWLKGHLKRFDLQCVSGMETLDKTPFSMTQQGLIHLEKGRFEKKDQKKIDDRRGWCLGFSNKSRLALLNRDKKQAEQQLLELYDQSERVRAAWDEVLDRERLWQSLQDYQWKQINVPYWQQRTQSLQSEVDALEASGGDLAQAKTRWEAAKEEQGRLKQEVAGLLAKRGGLDNQKSQASKQVEHYQAQAAVGITEEAKTLLVARVGEITLETADQQRVLEQALEKELETVRSRKSSAERSANGTMGAFRGKDKWLPITADWPSGLEGLPYYVDYFHYIEKEGLPELIEQFKKRLNKHATQSLARIKTKLDAEREEILERIDTINTVLHGTEFKQGSYLKLGSKREKYPHVQEFERKIKKALSQATSDDHETRFKLLSEVVQILDKASNSATAHTLESLRLLDARYQMSFYAEEIDMQTGKTLDVLESSSGKSGGEKESFAGTVVAASLAYVLTPEDEDRPIYCTVFLDEAFSNTAEAVSRRVLKVFKALHLHVNLITPYKNLNLARESARSLLIAERDPEHHESHLCEVTWEEIDRRIAKQANIATIQETSSEIELECL